MSLNSWPIFWLIGWLMCKVVVVSFNLEWRTFAPWLLVTQIQSLGPTI